MVDVCFKRKQNESVCFTAVSYRLLRYGFNFSGQKFSAVFRYPDEVIGRLVVAPSGFTGLQCIVHHVYSTNVSTCLQTVRIVPVKAGKLLATVLRDGQIEAGKVWTLCRDAQKAAMRNHERWPNRDSLQKAIKGKFALHSQSAQMVCRAFLGNVATTTELRKAGNKKARYPWRDKRFYPLMWPAQAMTVSEKHIVLPMGRGRKSVVLPRPEWLTEKSAAKIVWNGCGYELHVTVENEQQGATGSGRGTIDLGQIHQCAVTTDNGKALIVSGRGIRSEKRRLNKMHRDLAQLRSRCKKGSKRYGKLQRARNKYALRSKRRIRDARHKGTRTAIAFCQHNNVGVLFIGDPNGVRKKNCGRKQNQRMSQWE